MRLVLANSGPNTRANGQHLGIVGHTGPLGGGNIVALLGAHAGHLVRGDVYFDAGSAADDGPLVLALRKGLDDFDSNVRLIDRILEINPKGLPLVAAVAQILGQSFLELKGRVVGPYRASCDLPKTSTSGFVAASPVTTLKYERFSCQARNTCIWLVEWLDSTDF